MLETYVLCLVLNVPLEIPSSLEVLRLTLW